MRIYIVYGDMEDDEPAAYCVHEEDAQALLAGNEVGDYWPVEIPDHLWRTLLDAGRSVDNWPKREIFPPEDKS